MHPGCFWSGNTGRKPLKWAMWEEKEPQGMSKVTTHDLFIPFPLWNLITSIFRPLLGEEGQAGVAWPCPIVQLCFPSLVCPPTYMSQIWLHVHVQLLSESDLEHFHHPKSLPDQCPQHLPSICEEEHATAVSGREHHLTWAAYERICSRWWGERQGLVQRWLLPDVCFTLK